MTSYSRYRNDRICEKCIEEDDLQEYIASANGEPGCDFCGREDARTCDFGDFMDHVEECVRGKYDQAVNWLSYVTREGGYVGETWDTYDLLTDTLGIGLPRDHNGDLLRAMIDCIGDEPWCVIDPYGNDPLSALRGGWTNFCDVIKHHTRFFLDRWSAQPSRFRHNDSPTPAEVLTSLGDRIRRLELFETLPKGTDIYRARYCSHGTPWVLPADLGPPPIDKALVNNRMSPPGIVMFYGAMNVETALAETGEASGLYTVATFRTRRDLWLLDLTNIPQPPRFFQPIPDSQAWSRVDAEFFRDLVTDFARPIERDDRVHVEYIPTQVFTEYCRLQFHHEHGIPPLDGILYPSARKPGQAAVVLFADRSAVHGVVPLAPGKTDDSWLELVDVQHLQWLP